MTDVITHTNFIQRYSFENIKFIGERHLLTPHLVKIEKKENISGERTPRLSEESHIFK